MARKKRKLSLRQIVSYRWVVRNIPFFLFLAVLAVLYIANGHYADNSIRHITSTANELKELQYEYKTAKSELMYKTRESEMVEAAAPLGLKLSPESPVHILTAEKMGKNK
ncbi:MAG: FtsL-like putative cell division protein [Bacteroidota bacterium]|nr:FtsL-like putative cell division protein [Bacteroidota bacterium]